MKSSSLTAWFISRPNTHELNQTTRSHKRSSSLCKQLPHSRSFATASNNSSCVVSLGYFPSFPAFCCTVTSKKPEQPLYITCHIGFFQLRAHHRKVVKSAFQAKSSPWAHGCRCEQGRCAKKLSRYHSHQREMKRRQTGHGCLLVLHANFTNDRPF